MMKYKVSTKQREETMISGDVPEWRRRGPGGVVGAIVLNGGRDQEKEKGQHLVRKGEDSCVDIRQLRRLLHLLVSRVHLPVLDVVSASEMCYFSKHIFAIVHVD